MNLNQKQKDYIMSVGLDAADADEIARLGEEGGDDVFEGKREHIQSLMPKAHPAIIQYILTSHSWDGRRNNDNEIKKAYEFLKGIDGMPDTNKLDNLNKTLSSVFAEYTNDGIKSVDFAFEPKVPTWEQREKLEKELHGTEKEEVGSELKAFDAAVFAMNFIPEAFGDPNPVLD